MRKFLPILFFFIITFSFFSPFFLKGLLPIPSDAIVGLYHPFRDLYAKDYPNGIPFKNFLITDPVRQQYPWRNLAIDLEKKFELPLWNPYNFAGTPLLANFQSAPFYPLNILLFTLPFEYGWSILIILQPLLAGIFLYLYLRNLKLNIYSCLLGAISFAFCGFSIAWLEWGTVIHTAVWLPLVLLSIDKILSNSTDSKISNLKFQISNKQIRIWSLIFVFSLVSSFFAGHLQVFFYLFTVSFSYPIVRLWQLGIQKKTFLLFAFCFLLFAIITIFQWLPTLQFINLSARNIDQSWLKEGWFIPWQNLAQFVAPDFFGNPTTLNYWGVWNYAEFVGYIGIFPLIMAVFALFFRRDKKTLFFGTVFFLSLIFSLPTIFAKIPYILQIPFLSTAQPTRLLFLTDFSLAVLSALGSDLLIRSYRKKQVFSIVSFFTIIFMSLWIFVLFGGKLINGISSGNLLVAKRNLYFPTIIFAVVTILVIAYGLFRNKTLRSIIIVTLLIITTIDLLKFGSKFSPFTPKEYLFSNTKSLEFLQKQKGQFRIMSTDDRILPPNFSAMYRLQGIDGYDPLYLLRYGELISASERGRPDISPPFGFNRIITPRNYNSKIIDLLGVKYVLSLSELSSPKLKKVFQEGETRIYENNRAFPRAFFVKNVVLASNKNEAIKKMFDSGIDFKKNAIVETNDKNIRSDNFVNGSVVIMQYGQNQVLLQTNAKTSGFLVMMDTFYPSWHTRICSLDETNCQQTKIYLTNYNFRGVMVPKGEYKVIFENSLL